jgi:hypothetical protein
MFRLPALLRDVNRFLHRVKAYVLQYDLDVRRRTIVPVDPLPNAFSFDQIPKISLGENDPQSRYRHAASSASFDVE